MDNEHEKRPSPQAIEPGALGALLTEFQCLRTEIEWLIRNGMRYQSFAITIAAAGLSTGAFTISQQPDVYPGLAAALSLLLSWLGILYYWEHVEIHVVAGYLQQVHREKIRTITGVVTWWEWEEYKRKSWKAIGDPNLFRWRLASFLLVSLPFALTALGAAWLHWDSLRDKRFIAYTSLFLFIFALILIARLAFLLFWRSDLIQRFLAVHTNSQ